MNLLNNFKFGGRAQICSVSFTSIFLPPSRIDVKYILHAITVHRSEFCCLQLISSLLASCQLDTNGSDSESETSSIEILKALTSHMTSGVSPLNGNTHQSTGQDPTMAFFDRMVSARGQNSNNIGNDDYLEKMVSNEEDYFAFVLLKCMQLCPSIFGESISELVHFGSQATFHYLFDFADTQPTKSDIVKSVNRATRSLWTQTGATLEHVLLWWCSTPLACQPVAAAKHLRDWLLNIQYDGKDIKYPFMDNIQWMNMDILFLGRGT